MIFPVGFSLFYINFVFCWHYNSFWVSDYSTILFHVFLTIAIMLQFCIFIFPKSTHSKVTRFAIISLYLPHIYHNINPECKEIRMPVPSD